MWSIIKNKLRMLIILMVVFELNTGTETENDWFSQYGEERDAGEDVVETGMEEGEVGGILKQKEACQHDNYLLLFVLCGDCYNFLSQLVMTTIGPRGSTAAEMTMATASTGAMMSTVALGVSTMTGTRVSLSGYAQETRYILTGGYG